MKVLSLDERTSRLRRMVYVARHEADHAVAYREAWRPMAHDSDLHLRMGQSFASNTFLTIRLALWREMLASLMRVWDGRDDSINLAWMIAETQKEDVRVKLFDENRQRATDRSPRSSVGAGADSEGVTRLFMSVQIRSGMLETVRTTAAQAAALFQDYRSGVGEADLQFLKRVRHEQLAHRQNTALTTSPADWGDDRIEQFFTHTIKIVSLLLSVVEAVAYDLNETADVYSGHARLFWASARGERTEGHPSYRPAPNLDGPWS